MKKDVQINQILLIFPFLYFNVNYWSPLGPELRAANFRRGKQDQQVSGHCGSLSQKSFICINSCSKVFIFEICVGVDFHRVSACFVHVKKNNLALWTCFHLEGLLLKMELLSGLHSQDIESMLCVCLPYLTKDQMQQHCGSNDAGMLEET